MEKVGRNWVVIALLLLFEINAKTISISNTIFQTMKMSRIPNKDISIWPRSWYKWAVINRTYAVSHIVNYKHVMNAIIILEVIHFAFDLCLHSCWCVGGWILLILHFPWATLVARHRVSCKLYWRIFLTDSLGGGFNFPFCSLPFSIH